MSFILTNHSWFRKPALVEVGSWSQHLPGFIYKSQVVVWEFFHHNMKLFVFSNLGLSMQVVKWNVTKMVVECLKDCHLVYLYRWSSISSTSDVFTWVYHLKISSLLGQIMIFHLHLDFPGIREFPILNHQSTSSPRYNQHNVGPPSRSGNLQGGVNGASHLQCLAEKRQTLDTTNISRYTYAYNYININEYKPIYIYMYTQRKKNIYIYINILVCIWFCKYVNAWKFGKKNLSLYINIWCASH